MAIASDAQIKFFLVVYRMPAKPTAGRVAVWRQLKRVGAVYLQQSICVFPDNARIRRELSPILEKIRQNNGEYHLLPLRQPSAGEYDKLVAEFLDQTSRQYQEIIENCEVNFQKEIEFETFRNNFTYEEAEEIRVEFDKIVNWFERVRSRDWFGAPNRDEARAWLDKCEKLLEEFEAKVYAIQEERGVSGTPSIGRRDRRSRGRGRLLVVSHAGQPMHEDAGLLETES
jgi:phenylpropionate dioxygenase-like ring-hydroxylating dioxygenase large terminal subunit